MRYCPRRNPSDHRKEYCVTRFLLPAKHFLQLGLRRIMLAAESGHFLVACHFCTSGRLVHRFKEVAGFVLRRNLETARPVKNYDLWTNVLNMTALFSHHPYDERVHLRIQMEDGIPVARPFPYLVSSFIGNVARIIRSIRRETGV
jgi:hypothetical protein